MKNKNKNMENILGMDLISIIFVFILTALPTFLWFMFFDKEHSEGFKASLYAIIAGGFSTIPMLFYKSLWGKEGNFVFFKVEAVNFQENIGNILGSSSVLFSDGGTFFSAAILSVIFSYIGVGFLEEGFKQIVVNTHFVGYIIFTLILTIIGFLVVQGFSPVILALCAYVIFIINIRKFVKFKSIDDMICVSILAALGFSLFENFIYFKASLESIGGSVMELSDGELKQFLGFAFIRTTVVTMVHVLCSGVLGYHIGLAHFSHPELKEELSEGRKHPVLDFLHKLFKTPEDKMFMYEQVIIGLVLSIGLHALYDSLIHLDLKIGTFSLLVPLMSAYLFGGTIYLMRILEEKNNRKKYGQLVKKEEYIN